MVNEPVAILAFEEDDGTMVHIPFSGTNERTVKMDAQYVRIQNRLLKVDTYLQEAHTVCTMVTSERMRENCKRLAKSEQPMLYDGHTYYDITILDIEFVDKIPWREPQPYKISYIYTEVDAEEFENS